MVTSSDVPRSMSDNQVSLRAETKAQHWRPRGILRHHLDAVQSIAFDKTRLVLVSARMMERSSTGVWTRHMRRLRPVCLIAAAAGARCLRLLLPRPLLCRQRARSP